MAVTQKFALTLLTIAGLVLATSAGPLRVQATGSSQMPAPALRAGVGLVQVPVVVRDSEGHLVRDLPADAFAVFEAGRRMTLIGVETVRRDPALDSYVPREILIVVDDANTRAEVMPRASQAARALIDRLDPRDRVALVNTSKQPPLSVDFTTTRTPLVHALERVRGQDLPDGGLARWRGGQALEVMRALLDQLRREATGQRRVSLVLFSEGYGIAPIEQSGMVTRELLADVRTIVGLAAQANVAIYAIDPAGLEARNGPFRATGSRPVGPAASMSRAGMPVSSSLRAPDDLSALGALAHDTGGRLTRSTNDLLAHVPEMLSDADEYYLLTYEMPEVTDRDRKKPGPHIRQIDVRIHRPGLTVRARQGYVHPLALS